MTSQLDTWWEEVASMDKAGRPRSAQEIVRDKILPAAREHNHTAHLLKALIHLGTYAVHTDDVGMDMGVALLEKELAERTVVRSAADVAFLHSLLGEMYEKYVAMVGYRISDRTDVAVENNNNIPSAATSDMKTWSVGQLERAAFAHYMASIDHAEELRQESVEHYKLLLVGDDKAYQSLARFRPSLFDLLAYRALEYFSKESSFLSEAANCFVLKDEDALLPVEEFVKKTFVNANTHKHNGKRKRDDDNNNNTEEGSSIVIFSRKEKALQLFQLVLRLHISDADPSSLALADLRRAKFVHNTIVAEKAKKNELYLKLLEGMKDKLINGHCDVAAEVLFELGRYYASLGQEEEEEEDEETAMTEQKEGLTLLQRAAGYYKQGAELFPQSPGGSSCAEALRHMELPYLRLIVEQATGPEQPLLAKVEFRNIPHMQYYVVDVSNLEEKPRSTQEEQIQAYLNCPPVSATTTTAATTTVQFPGKAAADYKQHGTEIIIPAVNRFGKFAVIAWFVRDPKEAPTPKTYPLCITTFTATNIATLFLREGEDAVSQRMVIVHRFTGQPLAGVTAHFYTLSWHNQNRTHDRIPAGTAESDSDGVITLLPGGNSQVLRPVLQRGGDVISSINTDEKNVLHGHRLTSEGSQHVRYTLGDDKYVDGDQVYLSNNRGGRTYMPHTEIRFFTDRNIYRPGQTIYFKGLVLEFPGGLHSTTVPVVVANKEIQVRLRDANRQFRGDPLKFRTGEYGTFEGTITAPLTGLTGQMSLHGEVQEGPLRHSAVRGSISFQVEEYKRPRFDVTATIPPQNVRVGDEVTVTAKAVSFAGVSLVGAQVKYRVQRRAQRPWFCGWGLFRFLDSGDYGYDCGFRGPRCCGFRGPRWGGNTAEVEENETTITAQDGTVELRFHAVPDSSIPAEEKPEFRYTVSIDVTDITGETHTCEASVTVGYVALRTTFILTGPTTLQSLKQVDVPLTDLNNNPLDAAASITFTEITAPYPLGSPFIPRRWKMPDVTMTDHSVFKAAFPYYAHGADEVDPLRWPLAHNKGEVRRGVCQVKSEKGKASKSIDLVQCCAASEGGLKLRDTAYYRVTFRAKDIYDNPIEVSTTIHVYDESNRESASLVAGGVQSPYVTFSKQAYHVGDKVEVFYGSRRRFDGQPQPFMVGAILNGGHLEAMKWAPTPLPTSSSSVHHLTIPVALTEKQRGYMGAVAVFVAYGRVFQSQQSSVLPWTDKELHFEYGTFRDKLQPGQQEQWTITVSGEKKDEFISGAEVLATMYDASLDTLKGNHPHSYDSLSHRGLFPLPTPELNCNQGVLFGSSHPVRATTPASRVFDGRGTAPTRTFPQLNWFRFPFREKRSPNSLKRCFGGGGGRGMMAMCARSAAPMEMMACAAPCDELDAGPPMMAKEIQMMSEPRVFGAEANIKGNDNDGNNNNNNNNDNSNDADSSATTAVNAPITIRTNLKETVFFLPQLRTDEKGNVVISFTMGEALTRWRFLAFAHTKSMQLGATTNTVITQKELMVAPHPPRFFREGDTVAFATKVSNMGNTTRKIRVSLELYDALTRREINKEYGLDSNNSQLVQVAGDGASTAVRWSLKVPFGGASAVTWRVVARTEEEQPQVSDGEESTLPVLTNRKLVTETMPMTVRSGVKDKKYAFESFQRLATEAASGSGNSTLRHEALTVEFTTNPAWYAIQALPYLMEFPHECSEQIFSRYYANTLASLVASSQPEIEKTYEKWRTISAEAQNQPQQATAALTHQRDPLESNLCRNQELKSALVEETPWVLEAQSETAQKSQVAMLFDLNRMAGERLRAVQELERRQGSEGGFCWFPGGSPSVYITQHIASGFAHLAHLNVAATRGKKSTTDSSSQEVRQVAKKVQRKAQDFCYGELVERYQKIKRENTSPSYHHLTALDLLFLYTESFSWIEASEHTDRSNKDALVYYMDLAAKHWQEAGLYQQALIALILHRSTSSPLFKNNAGDYSTITKAMITSLLERAVRKEELGMYWAYDNGYRFYEMPIETHALLIEVFDEVAKDVEAVDEMRLWLLKNKQTKHWKSTKATAEAVYALILGGENNWLVSKHDQQGPEITVTVGNTPVFPPSSSSSSSGGSTVDAEPGTGYVKRRFRGADVTVDMSVITVSNNKPKGSSVAWGAAYWQYFEDLEKIKTFTQTPLTVKKALFIVESDAALRQTLRPISEGVTIPIGSKLKSRVEIVVDREMDYVHLKDMRAAGLEPTNVLSRYKWQDGVGYYESTKDLATHFFFDHLPKGTHVLEYELMASQLGEFSNGIATLQCMYAPEFSSHSQGTRIEIVEKK